MMYNDGDSLALVDQLNRSDQSAMKKIFMTYHDAVYKSIFRFVKNRELSEDLTQEVFLKIWKKREHLQIRQTLKGYILTMAYHEAMGHLRTNAPLQSSELDDGDTQGEDGHAVMEGIELERRVKTVIDQLPPRCRNVFLLSRFEGKKYREIAEIMEISIKTVENQMIKALGVLRDELQDYLHMFWLCTMSILFF